MTYLSIERQRRKMRRESLESALVALALLVGLVVGVWQMAINSKSAPIWSQNEIWVQTPTIEAQATTEGQNLTIKRVVAERQREISAYNVGDPAQTDDTPCIGASGVDICNLLDHGICVYAANFVPLGTYLQTEDFGECQVLDRMNSKYPNRVDVAMPKDSKAAAIAYGLQTHNVRVLEN